MLKEILLVELFGQFNYDIKLNESGMTIITGPNGYGKSTILKIIEAIEEKDLFEISKFSFKRLTIILTNKMCLTIEKGSKQIVVNNVSLKIPNERILDIFEKRRIPPMFERIGLKEYVDLRTSKLLSFEEVQDIKIQNIRERSVIDKLINFNIETAKENKNSQAKYKELNEFLIAFKKELGPIKFIKEQRLIRKELDDIDSRYLSHKREVAIEVIKEIPQKIMDKIKDAVLKYSEVSSQLDSTFPKRLFNTKAGISQTEYLNELSELVSKQEKIQDYKLLNDLKYSSTEYGKSYSQALRVYIQDTKQKLEVFDDIILRLDLFTNIVNKKLNYKKVTISNEKGLIVLRNDGSELETSKLSSGEQQIIVLYYELIFGVKDKLMLLIDEPEISLHVAWQRELMKDFQKIIKMQKGNLYLLVATHAPQVIDNNWNLVIDLGEEYAKQ